MRKKIIVIECASWYQREYDIYRIKSTFIGNKTKNKKI